MNDTIPAEGNNTLKARCLRLLSDNEGKRFTGADVAAILNHTPVSSVQSTLGAAYEECVDGWQWIHRTTNTRPIEYWHDPTVERTVAVEVVEMDDTMTVMGTVGQKLICRRDRDRSMWIAYQMSDGDL